MKILTALAGALDTIISLSLAVIGTYFLIKGSFPMACILLFTHSIWQIPRILIILLKDKYNEELKDII